MQFADPLHARIGGRIGDLRRVLARAMAAVVDEKANPDTAEVITGEHIFGAAGATAVTPPPIGDSDGRGQVA